MVSGFSQTQQYIILFYFDDICNSINDCTILILLLHIITYDLLLYVTDYWSYSFVISMYFNENVKCSCYGFYL